VVRRTVGVALNSSRLDFDGGDWPVLELSLVSLLLGTGEL